MLPESVRRPVVAPSVPAYRIRRARIGELGRTCIAARHRRLVVLKRLWGGIAEWADLHGVRYLVCGPPAIDREFRTIDLLTWIDLNAPRLASIRRPGASAAAARHPDLGAAP